MRRCRIFILVLLAARALALSETLLSAMSAAVGESLGEAVRLAPAASRARGGGGGADVGVVEDRVSGARYFTKIAPRSKLGMLAAEHAGVAAIAATRTVRVPAPVAVGATATQAFLVLEELAPLSTDKRAVARELAVSLARMHSHTSACGRFGFELDNTIGETPQPNAWAASWSEFFVERRLAHMFALCRRVGGVFRGEAALLDRARAMLAAHEPAPSLCHGDLWSGNAGCLEGEGRACVFDPAAYYGDREVDIAMSRLFGSFPDAFYASYEAEAPLAPGHEARRDLYDLYHMLNHYVLFGGSYREQAQRLIDRVLGLSPQEEEDVWDEDL